MRFPLYVTYRAPKKYIYEFIMRTDDDIRDKSNSNALSLQENDKSDEADPKFVRSYSNYTMEQIALLNIEKFGKTDASRKYFVLLNDSLAKKDQVEICEVLAMTENSNDIPNQGNNISVKSFNIHIKDATLCLISLENGEMRMEDYLV